jgi:hypothetical protein
MHLDVSEPEAVRVGRGQDQRAIWDCAAGRSINV